MSRRWPGAARWLALAILCGLGTATLLWLPARWLAGLLPSGVACAVWSGTLWNGRCTGLAISGSRSGDLSWAFAPQLNSLTMPISLYWSAGDSSARATVRVRPAGGLSAVRAEILELDITLQTLRNALPANLRLGPLAALEGRLLARGLNVAFAADQTLQASGELRLNGIELLRANQPLGDVVAQFTALPGQTARGIVRDRGGPVQLRGEVEFAAARTYRAVFRLEARSSAAAQALGIAAPFEVTLEGRF